ncbi:hypothetical protein IQ07DRAFT_129931 [Pyrenochaeta sp. DS3sAY3a]|nr:hypothetical protein IQ07DRAFT_129931 [Pyrenochaeta sp. DS3sAY3a]
MMFPASYLGNESDEEVGGRKSASIMTIRKTEDNQSASLWKESIGENALGFGFERDLLDELDENEYHDEVLTEILQEQDDEDFFKFEAERESQIHIASVENQFDELWMLFDEFQDVCYDDPDHLDEMRTAFLREAYEEDVMRLEALREEQEKEYDTSVKEFLDEMYDTHGIDYLDEMHTKILRDAHEEDFLRSEALREEYEFEEHGKLGEKLHENYDALDDEYADHYGSENTEEQDDMEENYSLES